MSDEKHNCPCCSFGERPRYDYDLNYRIFNMGNRISKYYVILDGIENYNTVEEIFNSKRFTKHGSILSIFGLILKRFFNSKMCCRGCHMCLYRKIKNRIDNIDDENIEIVVSEFLNERLKKSLVMNNKIEKALNAKTIPTKSI